MSPLLFGITLLSDLFLSLYFISLGFYALFPLILVRKKNYDQQTPDSLDRKPLSELGFEQDIKISGKRWL